MKNKYWVGYYDNPVTDEKKRFFIADESDGLPYGSNRETKHLHDVQLIEANDRTEAEKIFLVRQAAPELLAIAESYLYWLYHDLQKETDDSKKTRFEAQYKKVKAAIAKATGEKKIKVTSVRDEFFEMFKP